MAIGQLGKAVLLASTNTTVYTVPANTRCAEVAINILNPGAANAIVKVAIAAAAVPVASEYIENGVAVPLGGGVLERTNIICSPGERVVVFSDQADLVVRVSGEEKT